MDQTLTPKKEPLYVEIYVYLKEMILNKTYKEHDKLPSKRTLSQLLKVSPLTVDRSYQQLIMEGYVYAIEKSGYYVSKQVDMLVGAETKHTLLKPKVTMKDSYAYEFKTNVVDTSIFPNATWAKLAREVLSENKHEMLNESNPKGMELLRYEIARFLEVYRGMIVDVEQIIVGSGTTSLISMIVELLGRNKTYAIEDPSYHKIFQLFTSNDVNLIPIPLDTLGMELKTLLQSHASVIHITPSHQFPTGIVMPIQRRTELLNWASTHNRFIIEDDYDSEFRFTGKPIPSLQSIDQNDCVIYMNTFTKTLAPSFRMSYMVLPKKLLASYENISSYQSCTVPNFEQYIMYKFIHGRFFERHIFRMKKLYKQKIDVITETLSKYPYLEVLGLDVGLHSLLVVKGNKDEEGLIKHLESKNIYIRGLHGYYVHKKHVNETTLILGYSGIPLNALKESLHALIHSIDVYIKKPI
jgi:GntR family transcriptional regulator / MocR family aminotransferase